jgi:radical SAM superfamily enzyme YgiQ (UPF0313 family)
LAGHVKKSVGIDKAECILFDTYVDSIEMIVQYILTEKPTFLGFSLEPGTTHQAQAIIKQIKEKMSRAEMPQIVFGKNGATFSYEQLLMLYPDAICVLGEGELAVEGLLRYSRGEIDSLDQVPNLIFNQDGHSHKTSWKIIADLSTLGEPNFVRVNDLYEVFRGDLRVQLEASRGCPWMHCTFCESCFFWMQNNVQGEKNYWRPKPIKQVVAEMKKMNELGVKFIPFADEEFIGAGSDGVLRTQKLAQAIIDEHMPLKFFINVRADNIYNEQDTEVERAERMKMLDLLYKAGCEIIFLGVESGSPTQLMRYGKGHKVVNSEKAIEILRSRFRIQMGFLPIDVLVSKKELIENIDFIEKNNAYEYLMAPLNQMRVYEHTGYYKMVRNVEKKEGIQLLGDFDIKTLEFKTIRYREEGVNDIVGFVKKYFQDYYTLYYTLKNWGRFFTKEECDRFQFIEDLWIAFNRLELRLLHNLCMLSDKELKDKQAHDILRAAYEERDAIITQLLISINQSGSRKKFAALAKEGVKCLKEASHNNSILNESAHEMFVNFSKSA